ncbi:MAG: hypothetical protein KAQ65_03735 [Candidatus Thorarchaeota archaeon]|nr:hypothetical protein [Candidatus Thorarchaeota archaeon]
MSDSKGASQPFVERLEARAYSRATEVPERVSKAILNLFSENTQEHVLISESRVEGHQGLPILILTGVMSDKKLTENAVTLLFQKLSAGDLNHILKSLNRRIDDECTFFLRIDKQAAYLEQIELSMNDDVISLQIVIRNLPRCSTTDAEDLIRRFISLTGVLER